MRRLLATALLAVLVVAASAHASPSQTMLFDAAFQLRDPATRDRAFGDLASEGVHALRVVLYWHDVAPAPEDRSTPAGFDAADPAGYDWSSFDPVLAGASERGWSVLLTVSGPVPRWATIARRDTRTRPDPARFQAFMTAVARHYGTEVATWSIWNEPNHPQFLMPQYVRGKPVSGVWYRKLWLAGYRGLEAGGLKAPKVLFGEMEPRGNGHDVAPLTFLRQALRLDSSYRRDNRSRRLPVGGIAEHPYTTRLGPSFQPRAPDDVTIGVLGRLVRAVRKAGKAGAIPPNTRIWLTEYGVQTKPDPLMGVSQAQQVEYQAISERMAYDTPRVAAFSQYPLTDDPPRKGVKGFHRFNGLESGLYLHGGQPKDLVRGFRIPLAARRQGSTTSLWGIVRPATGPTTVTVQGGTSRFRTILQARTNARGVWSRRVAYHRGQRFRVLWTAPDGTRYTGPPIRSYD